MALVTNTRRDLTERALNSIGRHYFSVSVCGDEVEHAKPAPDIYRRAAELLGFEPGECLAVEDSVTGAAAAEAAGCPVLVIPYEVVVPGSPRRRHENSLSELDVDDLLLDAELLGDSHAVEQSLVLCAVVGGGEVDLQHVQELVAFGRGHDNPCPSALVVLGPVEVEGPFL